MTYDGQYDRHSLAANGDYSHGELLWRSTIDDNAERVAARGRAFARIDVTREVRRAREDKCPFKITILGTQIGERREIMTDGKLDTLLCFSRFSLFDVRRFLPWRLSHRWSTSEHGQNTPRHTVGTFEI